MKTGKYRTTKKSGKEPFHVYGQRLGFNLFSFWQWSSSDILGNALRGVLAEYIVAMAVGCITPVREQQKYSAISFGIQPTYGWDGETNCHNNELKRQTDVYVFCRLNHKEKATVDPLNLGQWDVYALTTKILDSERPTQKTISLASLLGLNPLTVDYGGVASAIKQVLEID